MDLDFSQPPFELPPLGGGEAPVFANAVAAKQWAHALPLANPADALFQLTVELDKLNRQALAPAERLAVLDALYKSISFALDESAKRYGGKPLPAVVGDQMVFDQAQTLRRACIHAALRALDDSRDDGDASVPAAALQRAVSHMASQQLDFLRARRQLPPGYWRQLHQLMALAEARGWATTAVRDPGRYGDSPTTSLAAYGEALLLHTCSPFELTTRQLSWVARWAKRWGAKLTLTTTPPASLDAMPITVDLASDQPPRHQPFSGPGARLLLTNDLRNSIKSRVALLGQGRSPAELQLGDDCVQPACERLLKQVYPRWCKGGLPRGAERKPENSPGYAIFGFEGIHYHLSGGKRLKQSATMPSIADLRREREQLATFGTLSTHQPTVADPGDIPPVETDWQIANESATCVRMARAGDGGSQGSKRARINLGQLVALEPPGASRPFLASLRWLLVDADGWLQAGARLMPGPVTAVAQRPADGDGAWLPGFLLPALPVTGEPSSALVPSGVFRVGRQLLLQEGGTLTLTKLLERGEDYERVAYE